MSNNGNIIRNCFLLLGVAIMIAACQKEMEMIDTHVDLLVDVEIPGIATRTSLEDDLTCVWDYGDEIAVYDGSAVREFIVSSINGSSAVFTGQMSVSSGTNYAAYPYSSASACTDGRWTLTIPSEQTVDDGYSTASGALAAVASFTDASSVSFKQVTGLVKVVLSQSDIVSIVIRGNNGETLSGTAVVAASDGSISSFSTKSETVTLTHSSGAFPAGTYFFAVAPVTLSSGLSLTLTDTGGAVSVKASSNSVTVPRAGGVNLGDVSCLTGSSTEVNDGCVNVVYKGASAMVTVAGNIAQYVTPTVSGAHVSIAQSSDLAEEITYTLSGTSTDGEFYMSGSYKATIELNGLTLTNATPVYSGAAVHIQNGKRIKVKVVTGTTNTLVDAASGSQKGCLYVKGHAEFAQKGTLNVTGNVKHGIKAGEYISLKNATINVLGAVGDGISCNEYFLMESGTISISGTGDDGIQCDLDGDSSTGETTDHEDEDSGNIYISDGSITATCTATAAKGIKCDGDMNITGGIITVETTGNGEWDSDDLETKAACGLGCDGNMTISGGTLNLTATGSGGKGMKCDGVMTISDGAISVATSGELYYNNGTTENTNYTGDTDNVSSDYYSSPKGIKAGVKTQSGNSYTYAGGLVISGGTITVNTDGHNGEGIESKNTLDITGGHITVNSYDDALNAARDLTIDNGYVFARATDNDGIDANGNCYINGGVVYAIGSSSPEVAIDANSEDQKKLYITGGTILAVGGLESGSSISGGTCKYTSSWTANSWYALYDDSDLALAFKTPASSSSDGNQGGPGGNHGGSSQQLVVYTTSTPSLKSGVTVNGGTEYFGGMANIGCTVSGGSTVSLSNYSSNSGSGPGGH